MNAERDYAAEEHVRGAAPRLLAALRQLADEFTGFLGEMEWESAPETPALSRAFSLLDELDNFEGK